MSRTSIFMFVLGILATVVVYEATGLRITAHGSLGTTNVAAQPVGTPATTGALGPSSVARVRTTLPSSAATAGSGLSDEEAAALRARTAYAESQVEAAEGRESAWPAGVAPEYRKESVERQLKKFVVDRGLAKIDRLDCSEFPCVSVLTLPENGSQARQKLHEALNEMIKENYSGRVALSLSSSQSGTGSDATSIAGVSVMPDDEDVKTRTRHRTNIELQDGGR